MILIKCLKICSAGQRSISTVKGNADMKKILVLNGSPRKDSVSSALCESLVSAADEAEIKKYNAYKMNAKPCMGCGYCDKNKSCCFDDLDEFMLDFEQADYFVISTPVYNSGVPAPLKAIVDRFQRYYALRFAHGVKPPVAKPKKAALVIAAGSKGEGKDEIKAMFERQFTVLNTELVSTVFFDGTDTHAPDEKTNAVIAQEGESFFNS